MNRLTTEERAKHTQPMNTTESQAGERTRENVESVTISTPPAEGVIFTPSGSGYTTPPIVTFTSGPDPQTIELISALKGMLTRYEKDFAVCHCGDISPDDFEEVKAARAAIERAEGRAG